MQKTKLHICRSFIYAVAFVCLLMSIKGMTVNAVSETDIPQISYTLDNDPDYISKKDATDELVFLETRQCVYAYDFDGEFQFSISFPYRQNGWTSIGCTNDLLYIKSLDNRIYVFDRDQCVEIFEQGSPEYTRIKNDTDWNSSNITRQGLDIYMVQTESGTVQIKLPEVCHKNIRVYVIFIILLLACGLILGIARKKHLEKQQTVVRADL